MRTRERRFVLALLGATSIPGLLGAAFHLSLLGPLSPSIAPPHARTPANQAVPIPNTLHEPAVAVAQNSTPVAHASAAKVAIRAPATSPALPAPVELKPFDPPRLSGEGEWHPAGRLVDHVPAVYETELRPPGSDTPAGIAWMDTRLLAARLYSGSNESPGGGPWQLTAPIEPAAAAAVVAAFNGGFKMPVAQGGYYTQRAWAVPPRKGAASLVIYSNGSATIGAWGNDVRMTPDVVSVRQNLHLLVVDGRPAADAGVIPDWGATVGNVSSTWRSGLGVTRKGALVYVAGPDLDPLSLARLLIRAGAVRGMELDINPNWTVLVTYHPPRTGEAAAPSNGASLIRGMVQRPSTFFDPWWARDFITMSARPLR